MIWPIVAHNLPPGNGWGGRPSHFQKLFELCADLGPTKAQRSLSRSPWTAPGIEYYTPLTDVRQMCVRCFLQAHTSSTFISTHSESPQYTKTKKLNCTWLCSRKSDSCASDWTTCFCNVVAESGPLARPASPTEQPTQPANIQILIHTHIHILLQILTKIQIRTETWQNLNRIWTEHNPNRIFELNNKKLNITQTEFQQKPYRIQTEKFQNPNKLLMKSWKTPGRTLNIIPSDSK